jgi:trans-aconitate methyltransferase
MRKKTAWYNETILPKQMVSKILNKNGFTKLEHSEHFIILDELIKITKSKNIADIGCGGAELGRVYYDFDYTGFDLPHIIENVSKVVNPNLNYVKFDAYDFDYTLFKKYDLLVCNGFISELIEPITVLKNLLDNTKKYLIIHRQIFENGDLITQRCRININELDELLINHKILKRIDNFGETSILIGKH